MNSLTLRDVYAALPLDVSRREIRVVDIIAAKRKDAPLQGSLRIVSLAECPDFTALSYVWGKPTSTQQFKMDLNNRWTHSLTENCFQALKQLRANYGALTIWVDSLCINQVDEAEKSTQIPLMGEIYTWARQVYIWLGNSSEESDMAMDWIWWKSHYKHGLAGLPLAAEASSLRERLAVSYRLMGTLLLSQLCHCMGSFYGAVPFISIVKPWGSRFTSSVELDSMALKLLSHPWFQRAWTFQELILAWDPVFLCGEKRLSWDTMACGADRVHQPLTASNVRRRSLMKPWSPSFRENRTSDQTDLNEKVEAILALLSIWMDIPRPTKWNGKRRRNSLPDNEDAVSALDYQVLLRAKGPISRWFRAICVIDQVLLVWALALFTWGLPSVIIALVNATTGPMSSTDAAFGTLIALSALGFILLLQFFIARQIPPRRTTNHWLPGSIGALRSLATEISLQRLWHPRSGHDERTKVLAKKVIMRLSCDDPIRFGTQPEKLSVTLDGIVRALRQRKATDVMDRVFALYGVMAHLKITLAQADYSQNKNEVYAQFLGDLLRWKPTLVFMIMDVQPTPAGRPSWVPDWNRISAEGWVDDSCFQINDVLNGLEEELRRISDALDKERAGLGDAVVGINPSSQRVHATRGSVASVHVDGEKLTVHGYSIDRVKWASGEIPWLSETDFHESAPSGGSPVLKLLEDLLWWTHLTRLEATYDHLATAVWNVLHLRWRVTSEPTSAGFKRLYRLLSNRASHLAGSSPESVEEATVLLYRDIRDRKEARDVLMEICEAIRGKRGLFFTEDGWIGTGAPGMKVGDEVSLVCGVPVPMILRISATASTGKRTYHVISPSFVEGAMYGNLYEEGKVEELVLV